jgi:hypothetical protein
LSVQFWNSIQQRIGKYLDIGSHARKEHSESDAVEHSKRMVRYRNQRAFHWDAIEIGALDFELHLHLLQQGFQTKPLRRTAHALIKFASLFQRNKFSGESRESGQARHIR